jgi:hypothetical protein
MINVLIILAVAAFILALAAAAGRAPLWVAVVVVAIIECLRAMPVGR